MPLDAANTASGTITLNNTPGPATNLQMISRHLEMGGPISLVIRPARVPSRPVGLHLLPPVPIVPARLRSLPDSVTSGRICKALEAPIIRNAR
jgi:hypothetical protein